MAEAPNEAHEVATGALSGAPARMRAGREAAGLSLEQVAERTRVPLRHLAALERGDYGALPGTTYCAGFARAFARAVDIDEASLIAEIRDEIAEMGGLGQDAYEFQEAVNPARVPPSALAWTAALIALLLAVGYGIWRMQLNTPPTEDQIAVQQAAAAGVTAPVNAVRPAPAPTPTGPVVLMAADQVWMRIYQPDGKRLFEGTLAAGQSYTVPPDARDPMILTGRPDALAVTVGGQAVPPLGTAERTISDVQISPGALLARPRQPAGGDDPLTATPGNAAAAAAPQAPPANAAAR